jgi:hypothetical protein
MARTRPRATHDQAERYRDAAELAIEQLDWCIGYLRQIRKVRIARVLHANRMEIVRRYRL